MQHEDQAPPTDRARGRRRDEPAESDDLFRRMLTENRDPEREAFRHRLIIAWMPMARRLAGRYRGRGEAAEDLQQVALLGLIKAVDRFDPARGHAFAAFAVPTIDGEIKRHFRDHLWTVHVPRSVQELRMQVRAACQEIDGEHRGGRPTAEAVAARTGLSEREARAGLAALDSLLTLSLDAPLDAGAAGVGVLGDTIGACDPALDAVVDREAVKPGLRDLPQRERTILFLRFFRDMKQIEIADQLGISQMHVSRLLNAVCAQLRTAAAEDPRAA
ncbi:SigB/SigF/SigG family RNA polymerase sigma factor [Actinacidiphila sp. ITFR-21]|uniref:SigB/SigF/SigG family RNA polymerase sigma factor n=1 Tax=Actinacidiphila sp. ITFR-21 TaxID=3075199 RepID=UPI00288A033F|nr:SigB/SigF/SigG family RNA polymerase sigma factor [Streptomyces sp. ITFR-21]WNI14291.1 SigB/SigF/SigG family RNA polymerase sigma factor [Streptomyces sp. ITFR-21]